MSSLGAVSSGSQNSLENTQLADLPFPDLVLKEILMNLNVSQIIALTEVNKKLNERTANNQPLWRALLVRDFGESAITNVSPDRYKAAYINEYVNTRDAIKRLSEGPYLLWRSREEKEIKLHGLLPFQDLKYIEEGMPMENLLKLFKECASLPHCDRSILDSVLKNPKMKQAMTTMDFGPNLVEAASCNNVYYMKFLLQFFRVDPNSFAKAFKRAIFNGNTEVVEILMKDNRFDLIPVHTDNHTPFVFNEVSPISLVQCVAYAIMMGLPRDPYSGELSKKRTKIIMLLMSIDRFQELPVNELIEILRFLAQAQIDQIPYIPLLVNNLRRFDEIPANDLGDIFALSLINKNTDAMEIMMNTPRFFNKIPLDGPSGLGYAFMTAIYTRNIAAINKIMANPRFKEIQTKGEFGLEEILSRTRLIDPRIFHMLCKNQTFINVIDCMDSQTRENCFNPPKRAKIEVNQLS